MKWTVTAFSVSDEVCFCGSITIVWVIVGIVGIKQKTPEASRMAALSPGLMLIRPPSLTGGWWGGKNCNGAMFWSWSLFCHVEASSAKLLEFNERPKRNDVSLSACVAVRWSNVLSNIWYLLAEVSLWSEGKYEVWRSWMLTCKADVAFS